MKNFFGILIIVIVIAFVYLFISGKYGQTNLFNEEVGVEQQIKISEEANQAEQQSRSYQKSFSPVNPPPQN